MEISRENSVKFCLKCRNNEKKALETKLKNHSGGVVIYVVGDGGIGKRALLKDAYENATIKEHFHIRIQVSFPEDTSNESIVKQIKDELIMHKKKLHGTTIGKEDIKDLRCLVMIESPVSSTEWAKAERILLAETCRQHAGSKIVLTTTSWNHKTKDNMVEMKHLNDYESKTLFNYFILGPDGHRKSNYKTRQMNLIRSNMEEITGGLPLAVVLLAKLMRTKEYNKWETAFECIRSSDEDDLLKTIVSVSIDDLPDELKSCLLYTSGFPEREVIDAHQLVRLWMAEGFLISQEHRMDMEKLGQRYLEELIYRGLLQPVDRSVHCVDSVTVHDRLQPLLRLEAQRTGFMNVHYGGHAPAPETTRRLALHNDNDKLPSLSNRLRKLRTVVAYYKEGATKAIVMPVPLTSSDDRSARKEKEPRVCKILELLKGSPFLRVIDLEGIDIGPALPSEIGDMVHLEYLGIRCRTLKEVPRSIKNLRKLQTIDVRDTDVKSFPSRLWKIKSLRHVLGHNLYLPESVGDLKLMETLETVRLIYHTDDCRDVATCAGEISLPGLRLLHRLHVVELNEEQADALKALLGEFSCLKSLALSGEVIPMGKLLASEASSASMEHVISLELYGQLLFDTAPANGIGNGGPFQDLQRCFSNLSRLVLKSTEVDQNFIDVIAEFPLLAELVLLTVSAMLHWVQKSRGAAAL
uniref:Uncharacterized protein n=1 Tax=Oryza punctata TaxID=4537 RepID=A0A0E0M6N9_ORYPU